MLKDIAYEVSRYVCRRRFIETLLLNAVIRMLRVCAVPLTPDQSVTVRSIHLHWYLSHIVFFNYDFSVCHFCSTVTYIPNVSCNLDHLFKLHSRRWSNLHSNVRIVLPC